MTSSHPFPQPIPYTTKHIISIFSFLSSPHYATSNSNPNYLPIFQFLNFFSYNQIGFGYPKPKFESNKLLGLDSQVNPSFLNGFGFIGGSYEFIVNVYTDIVRFDPNLTHCHPYSMAYYTHPQQYHIQDLRVAPYMLLALVKIEASPCILIMLVGIVQKQV